MELMAEIPKQIKDFFESREIVPMDFVKEGTEAEMKEKKNRREFEISKRRKRAQRKGMDNPMLIEKREKFIMDIALLGFPREDIELILDKKGLYAIDKSLVLELLTAMATIPELMAEK